MTEEEERRARWHEKVEQLRREGRLLFADEFLGEPGAPLDPESWLEPGPWRR